MREGAAVSASFEIDVEGLPAFEAALAAVPAALTRNLLTAANQSALYGESIAKQSAPVWMGLLRDSIQATPAVQAADGVSVTIGVGAAYAAYVEYGRGPIEARPGGVLRFVTRDGTVVFTKRVGPAKAQPFMQPAYERLASGVAERFFSEAVDRALAESGGGA